jgi:large subunit ribosomal protein L17
MNHGMKGRKFNRNGAQRKALLMSLAKALITHEQITTTLPKAKDLRPIVEKLVTLGKKGDLGSRRQAMGFMMGNTEEVKKLFGSLAERCRNRKGGYTRIIKAGFRLGDAAPRAIIEFVDRAVAPVAEATKPAKKAKKQAQVAA